MTDRAKYWQRMVRAWEASGLTQAEFCRRRGLTAANFAWWKRQLVGATGRGGRGRRAQPKGNVGQNRPSFVEVALPGAGATSRSGASASGESPEAGYEVALPGGTLIRLPTGFDVDRALQLIQAVARSC